MPSKLKHELDKVRGKVSATNKIYEDSIATIRDALTAAELAIKSLESNDVNYSTEINSLKGIAQHALSSANASIKKSGDTIDHLAINGVLIVGGTTTHHGNVDLNTHQITNPGNIDGRDVSVDGTKLDGIATAATKYPNTGEQAFLDADHTKLNGIATGADVTGSNTPKAHESSHDIGGSDVIPHITHHMWAWVNYDDAHASETILGILPAHAYVTRIFLHIITLFNDSTCGVYLGTGSANDIDAYMTVYTLTDVAAGVKTNMVWGVDQGYKAIAAGAVKTSFLKMGGDGNQGQAIIGIEYMIVGASP
jgi:hypothetical protein